MIQVAAPFPITRLIALPDGRLAVRAWADGAERLLTWSGVEGWRNGPEVPGGGRQLALLRDGRVAVGMNDDAALMLIAL